jgi:hypothetical protein
MMFYHFQSQEERRASGGGQLLEFRYCASGVDVLSLEAISFWKDDSLYLHHDDFAAFDVQYGEIIRGGTYHNQKTGPVDPCGLNWFSSSLTTEIVRKLEAAGNAEPLLLEWLKNAQANGFYILGI